MAMNPIRRSHRPLRITQDAKVAARTEHDSRILQSLARGEREIAARMGHDLDDVLMDADRLLADG